MMVPYQYGSTLMVVLVFFFFFSFFLKGCWGATWQRNAVYFRVNLRVTLPA